MKNAISIICFIISSHAFALETDNYLAWEIDLQDSLVHVNHYFEDNISGSLKSITNHQKSCEQITALVGKNFSSHLVHDNPVENWLIHILSSGEIYPSTLSYVEESIYRDPYRAYIPWFGLAPNIQINGIYMGTDKLSHFASTGMIYYRIFLQEKSRGASDEFAERKAIQWGIRDEKSVHGFWSSGVFSYADLEANYQGLKFYRRFCEGKTSYLAKNELNRWSLRSFPDLRNYVSGLWDETFEISYLMPENWSRVAPILKEEYCELRDSARVKTRLGNYRKNLPMSFSQTFLNELKGSSIPDPMREQSFSELCSRK